MGKLSKCGYYDWYLVRFSKGRFSNIKILKDKKPIDGKGRSIVLNKDVKNLSAHEVYDEDINDNESSHSNMKSKRSNISYEEEEMSRKESIISKKMKTQKSKKC